MNAALTLNYRRPELTIQCVHGLLADGWPCVLVWDNSADGGVAVAEVRKAFQGESRVHVVASEFNLGFAAGVNRGLEWLDRRLAADTVLVVNNDALTPPGTRDILLDRMARDESAALLAPHIEQNGVRDGWMYYLPWLGLVLRRPVPGAMPYLSGCCLLINRSALPGAVFDERFFMYGEDVELSMRCHRAGRTLVLVDDAWIQHKGSAGSGMGSAFYEELTVRSRLLLVDAWAWRVPGVRWLALATVTAAVVGRALVRSLRFRNLIPLRCAWNAVRKPFQPQGLNPGA